MKMLKITYRSDKRLKVVEVKSGSRGFIIHIDDFAHRTDIRDFEEPNGEAIIPAQTFIEMYKERVTEAKPTSFRFRRANNV